MFKILSATESWNRYIFTYSFEKSEFQENPEENHASIKQQVNMRRIHAGWKFPVVLEVYTDPQRTAINKQRTPILHVQSQAVPIYIITSFHSFHSPQHLSWEHYQRPRFVRNHASYGTMLRTEPRFVWIHTAFESRLHSVSYLKIANIKW